MKIQCKHILFFTIFFFASSKKVGTEGAPGRVNILTLNFAAKVLVGIDLISFKYISSLSIPLDISLIKKLKYYGFCTPNYTLKSYNRNV